MGFVPPRPPRWLTNVIFGRRPNIQNIPRETYTFSSTTSTTSTFRPPEPDRNDIIRAMRQAGWTIRETRNALNALVNAGISARSSLADFRNAIRDLGGAMSSYQMGYVSRVVITMSDGQEISIDDARVELNIDQETVDHYSSGSPIPDRSVVVNEDRRVTIEVNEETFFNTIRLIRED